MKTHLLRRRVRSLGVCGALSAVLAVASAAPALAGTTYNDSGMTWGDASACTNPVASQPFLSWKDQSWYTLVPGQSPGNFDGTGWTLQGGASIKAAAVNDGSTGSVLDLPTGSIAVSPPMCVETDYPTARLMVQNVVGAKGVQIYDAYAGTKTELSAQNSGTVHGNKNDWAPSPRFKIHPGSAAGWQLVRFTLVPAGTGSDYHVYNFYVDPRMYW